MENKNGQGIFYGVIGVATLVVAIIGATFAYFSASANITGDTIQGGTNDNLSGALSLVVTRVPFTGTTGVPATSGDGLVPTNIDGTATTIAPALTAGCVNGGYTGCHVYKLEATSNSAIANAYLRLDSLTVDMGVSGSENDNDWKWVAYTTEDNSEKAAPTVLASGTGQMDYTPAANAGFDFNAGNGFTANQTKTFYLMVYLANDANRSQNDTTAANDATGTYHGTVSFTGAGGGKVVATFTA